MSERIQILYAGLGLCASGMLVGANAVGYLPGEPSWSPAVPVAIGLLTTHGCARLLLKKSQ